MILIGRQKDLEWSRKKNAKRDRERTKVSEI